MSARKDHKIKRMRKKRVWPAVLLTIFAFMFSCVSVVVIVAYLCIFTFQGKMQNSQAKADDINTLLEKHIESEIQKVSLFEKQLDNAITSLDDKKNLQTELECMVDREGYLDVGIWQKDADAPYTANGISFSSDSSFYQAFLKGEEGVYPLDTKQGKYLIFTSLLESTKDQKAVFFLVEDAHLSLEGIEGNLLKGSAATHILNSQDETVAWIGNEERIPYQDLVKRKLEGLNGAIFASDEKVYLDYCQGMITAGGRGKKELTFDPIYLFSSYQPGKEDSSKNRIDGSVWIEKEMQVNGWRTVSNQHLLLNQAELNQLIESSISIIILMIVPLVLMLIMIFSQLHSRKKLTSLLYLDNVTGGRNWLYFKTIAARIMKKRRYRDQTYAMVAFEVNHFRIFCDYNGVDAGDDLLENLDQQLRGMVTKGEGFGRYAGAHFGILLKFQSEEQLKERLQNMFDMLSKNCTKDRISFSAGVYLITDKKVFVDILYNYACGAKNTVDGQLETHIAMFNSKIRDQQLWEKEVENTMEKAMDNKEFKVYLQPKYSTSTQELSGAEALVRWISEDKGFISPGAFIPVFEKNGFITKLDDYMLDSVAKLQAQWMKEGKKMVPISVNVSRVHFANPNLAEHIRDIVDVHGTPHHWIELELTESAFFDDKNILLNTVRKLKEYNFAVSMDDFGAGYSSLNSLKDLPLDVVKLDGEFFRGTEDKARGESVVRDTINLAKNLNMKIVAEGIETKDQVEFLAQNGCDLIQGFYFARPMPVGEFEQSAFKEAK